LLAASSMMGRFFSKTDSAPGPLLRLWSWRKNCDETSLSPNPSKRGASYNLRSSNH